MTVRMIQMSGVVVDMVYEVAAVPKPGTEAEVHSAMLSPGGGFNAMVAARRAGLDVAFAGTLGTGPLSDMVRGALREEGIAVLLASRDRGRDQGICTVLVDDAGERTFIGLPGADGTVEDSDLAGVVPRPPDWILQSGYALSYPGSRDALSRWLRRLPPSNLVFDPGPRVDAIPAPIRAAAMQDALWISANAAEAAALTELHDPSRAACVLASTCRPSGGAVVRTGADGAWLALPGAAPIHVPGHRVKAVDTNGAGDAHVGYFIAMLALGRTPRDALRTANIAAALSTTSKGPSTAPTLDRVRVELARDLQPSSQEGRPS